MISTAVPGPRGTDAGLTPLEPEHGCCDGLNWRCSTVGPLTADAFEHRTVATGFESRCRHPWLTLIRDEMGNEVAWVPATGRVQLRVHLTVERETRSEIARALYERLRKAVLDSTPKTDSALTMKARAV